MKHKNLLNLPLSVFHQIIGYLSEIKQAGLGKWYIFIVSIHGGEKYIHEKKIHQKNMLIGFLLQNLMWTLTTSQQTLILFNMWIWWIILLILF